MNEVENTMRALSEKPLLVKSRWCSFGIHKWTQYSSPKNRVEGIYNVIYQLRNCTSCGVCQVKVLRKTL